MLIKSYDFKTALLISLMIHSSVFIITSLKLFRKEIVLKDYRVVQLVDLNEPRSKPSGQVVRNSRPKAAQPKQTIETSPTPKQVEKPQDNSSSDEDSGSDDGFSSYMPVFRVTRLPEFVKKVNPAYPLEAKLKGIEREVVVEIYIDNEGKARKVVVVKSGGKDFDSATIDAVYKSSFSPALGVDGKAVPVRVRIPFSFELE